MICGNSFCISCDIKEGKIHLIVSFSSCLLWLASIKESEAVLKTVTFSARGCFCSLYPSGGFCNLITAALAGDELPTWENSNNLYPLTSCPSMQLNGASIGFTKIFDLKIVSENIFFESTSITLKEQANELHKACVLWNKSQIGGVISVRINSLKIVGFKHQQTATEEICEDEKKIIRFMHWCNGIFKYFNAVSNRKLD